MIRFLKNRSGATALEYCLIAMFVGLALVTAMTALGTNVGAQFTTVATVLR